VATSSLHVAGLLRLPRPPTLQNCLEAILDSFGRDEEFRVEEILSEWEARYVGKPSSENYGRTRTWHKFIVIRR
jgi:hypothetical protein